MQQRRGLQLISFLAFGVGITSFFFYHEFVAKNTYVSENALMPGSGRIEYDQTHIRNAIKQTARFQAHAVSINGSSISDNTDKEWTRGCASWILREFQNLGLDAHVYYFNNTTYHRTRTGVVVTGALRAGKGDGTEGIVLSSFFTIHASVTFTRMNLPASLPPEAAGGVGVLLSIAEFLRTRKWLAKDIIFVVSDSSESISHWLRDYHDGNLPQWVGALQAALHIGLRPWPVIAPTTNTPTNSKSAPITNSKENSRSHDDSIVIHLDGLNGQLPNLDIVNTLVHFTKVYHLRTSISLPLHPIGPFVDHCIKLGLPGSPYQEAKSLLAFMVRQAIGVPDDSNGPHPYFNQYNIDALSIDVDRDAMGQYEAGNSIVIPVLVLGAVRSLNNLLEHLHQSFYYYLLYRPNRYVSIGNYMISLGLILAPMFVYILLGLHWLSGAKEKSAGAVDIDTDTGTVTDTDTDTITDTITATVPVSTPRAGSIVVNAIAAFILHIGGIALYGFPIILGITNYTLWLLNILVATFSCLVIHSFPVDSKIFLLFATIPTVVFIASMSLMNFSFCVFAAVLVVPIYTLILYMHHKMNMVLQLLLVVISTPCVLYTIGTLCKASPELIFETILRHHTEHSTLLFPFLTLLYTPLNFGYFFTLWKNTNK